jgi:hypothetical protein
MKVGDRVYVVALYKVDEFNDEMWPYLTKPGTIVLELPPEWDYPTMYRLEMDDKSLEPLAFMESELAYL